ncbi:integrin-linked protein kinase 1-like isoform X2 [Hibiscus syriacus]|uniref:integrin-linked protein kinase 1-like isoform X2 n=1 Tax=Hibiscus syriacus TaxID=106335 RepID=UPI00192236B0|nr:integrin-linked protein kinase 1-like isoform X2 [Hibiscus syriacus]
MENKAAVRFTLGKQSSMAPERERSEPDGRGNKEGEEIDGGVRLMYSANEGDLEGIRELLESGIDVNFHDIDDRTALHVAACQGQTDVVSLLLQRGADVQSTDRWGSTPLADAIHYKNHDVIKLLEKHGAKLLMAPMHVNHAREVPEYEIDPKELDFTNSVGITKGTFCIALWRGTQVAVKKLGDEVFSDEEKVRAFRDELALFLKIRHPNVVQFLGAVTQSSPMMIVTEYLPKGDFRAFLNKKGPMKPVTALRYALDIARGMNYLHENKPAIIHRDLEPSNILRDDSGHLKVADFGVSKLLTVKEDKPLTCLDTSCRYVAPEVFSNHDYDTKVDVFSFALILQEVNFFYVSDHMISK